MSPDRLVFPVGRAAIAASTDVGGVKREHMVQETTHRHARACSDIHIHFTLSAQNCSFKGTGKRKTS